MFDNTNPYSLRVEVIDGISHYLISFNDGQAVLQETEVSRPVYLEFCRFIRHERNLRRSEERHMEQSEVTDETLYNRALFPSVSVEETAIDSIRNEHLRQAIQQLPETQRRRFTLYHEFGLTYDQLAEMEGCTKMPVKRSVDLAQEKIREKLKFFKK